MSMRDKMKMVAIEDKQRSWANEGLAQFVEILRTNNEDSSELLDNIIQNLVKYINANQGIIYILNDDDTYDPFLEVASCYAYNRKKYLKKRIEPGEGLAGQVMLEKETIYLTDVPENYVLISSGIGEARPRNVLIVPLKMDDKVFGLIEVAAFHLFKPFEIQFIEKLSESIASTISAVKVNSRTRKLLEESQFQAEQLKTQEEEIRQNMEELASTQEEMERVMAKVQSQERYIKNILNASKDSILTINKDYKVLNFNTNLRETYKAMGFDIAPGFDITNLLATEEEKRKHIAIYQRVLAGETIELQDKYVFNGIEAYYIFFWTPIRNENDEIIAIAIFLKDVTEINKAKELAQQQAEDLKAQEEELRQNMEELSTTQEELQRILKEAQEKEAFVTDLINSSTDTILTIDKEYKIILCNNATAETYSGTGLKIGKGFDIFQVINPEERPLYKSWYDRAFAGEHVEQTQSYQFGDINKHYSITCNPLRNNEGVIVAAAVFVKDITETVSAKLKTEQLLSESQQQEEELRQNMEELSATQEEIQRILKDVQEREAFVTDLINSTNDTILTIDKEYKIILCNNATNKTYSSMGIKLEKGFDIFRVISPEEKDKYKALYDRALGGEHFEITESYKFGDLDKYYAVTYSPLRNEEGVVVAAAAFGKDITESVSAKIRTEKLLNEAQQQGEELRQNMEELSAAQEEIQKILREIQSKEQYLTDLLNASDDMIVTIDKDLKIISCNTALKNNYKHLGFEIDKGFDILKLLSPEEQGKHLEIYKRVFAGEKVEITEHYQLEDIDLYINFAFSPLKDEQGEITSIAIYAMNVTEIITAKNEIEKNEKYITDLLNLSGDSILTIDRNFKVVSYNEVFSSSFSRNGVVISKGFDVLSLFNEKDRVEKAAHYNSDFAGEIYENIDHISENGMDNYFAVKFAPLHDQNGNIDNIAIFAKDITALVKAQKNAEELLKQSYQQTEEIKAQDEELRQTVEEISAIQEESTRHLSEIERLKSDLEIREKIFGLTTILSEADTHGTITMVNDKLCEISQFYREELIGQPHSIFRHPDMPKELFKVMWKTLKKGEPFSAIIKNRKKDGSHYWVDALIVPIKDEAGKTVKFVGARYHHANDEVGLKLYNEQAKKMNLPLLS
jgi:PAS domain S-box-containing protein